ncbi:MAG TPA: cupin domain-containing protein [Herpetosiphonaceae bacterium]|nr:cupin domain-containing protein [Herpetosiphonaceae bacterium]
MKDALTIYANAAPAGDPAPAVLATAETTGGLCALATVTLPPHYAGPPQDHVAEVAQGCYALSGTLALTYGSRTVTLERGSTVLVPPGVAYTYWNPTAAPAVVLLISLPDRMSDVGMSHLTSDI